MNNRKSNSSVAGLGSWKKLKYLFGLLAMYLQRRRDGDDHAGLLFNLEEYRENLRKYGTTSLEESRILEIGFGTRALRLIALNAIGADATGVDLDKPIINGTPREFREIWRKNGLERALKSIVRYWLNDRRERRSLYRKVAESSAPPRMPTEKMIVSSASDEALWDSFESKFDLILSEDVFEHIPRDELEIVVARMSGALSPGGIALIRPMIYSGISGGHQLEWYPYTIDQDMARDTEPWEHLRRDRDPADTYLNKMLRRDYRELFSRHFDILDERVLQPGLGAALMTPEIRTELSDYSDEELFSNNVMFVLKPRT